VVPQAPQLLLSDVRSAHALPQRVSVPEQLGTHDEPLQDTVPAVGVAQGVHDVGPQDAVDVLFEQVPVHSWVPVVHAHTPLWQVFPPVHANDAPHPPQLLLSLLKSTHPPAHELG
jgi:hypothetical protein